jgi:hypothetical protein
VKEVSREEKKRGGVLFIPFGLGVAALVLAIIGYRQQSNGIQSFERHNSKLDKRLDTFANGELVASESRRITMPFLFQMTPIV